MLEQRILTQPKERTIRPIDEIMAEATEKGSADLSSLSPAERSLVLEAFNMGHFPEEEHVALLEEFMRYDLVNDAQALQLIEKMQPVEKMQIGEYLGRVIVPGKYIQTFYECWPSLDEKTKQQFIKRFAIEDPDHISMVAPFIYISDVMLPGYEETDRNITRKSVLTKFNTVESFRSLFEPLLQYYKRHPDSIQEEGSVRFWRGNSTSESRAKKSQFYSSPARNIESMLTAFDKDKVYLLYPYLEELEALSFITTEKAKEYFDTEKHYFAYHDRTPDEDKEIKRLTRTLSHLETPDEFSHFDLFDAAPRKTAFTIQQINERGNARVTHQMLARFDEQKKRYGFNQSKFLFDRIEHGLPIFLEVESLGLTKEEVRVLMMRSFDELSNFPFNCTDFRDLKVLLDWNKKIQAGPDLEKSVIELLDRSLSQGDYFNVNRSLVTHIDLVTSWLSEENKNKLIQAINKTSPQLWLLNVPYVLQEQPMTFNDIVEKSAQHNDYMFLQYFHTLIYHASILKKGGKADGIHIEGLRNRARKILFEQPHLFFDKHLQSLIPTIFDSDEQATFVAEQLAKPLVDARFITALIRSPLVVSQKILCRTALLRHHALFEILQNTPIKSLEGILSYQEIMSVYMQHIDSIDVDDVFDSGDHVVQLLRSPTTFELLMATLSQSNEGGLVALGKIFRNYSESSRSTIKEWENRIAEDKRRLAQYKQILKSALPEEREDIESKIATLQATIKKRQHDTPEEIFTQERKDQAKEYASQLRKRILILCQKKKFFVFEEDVIDFIGIDGHEIVRNEIEEYAAIHPEILLSRRYSALTFESILGKELFERLFKTHMRALVFWRGPYGHAALDFQEVPEALKNEVESLNPVLKLCTEDHINKDYYESLLERVAHYTFYPLYASRLQKIAKDELAIYGPRLEVRAFEPKAEFRKIFQELSLLEYSPFAQKNREALMQLSAKDRNELIQILTFLSFYNLDGDEDMPALSDGLTVAKEVLLSKVMRYTKKLFELENITGSATEMMSIQTIRALSIYYSKTCRTQPNMRKAFQSTITPILEGSYATWRAWGDGIITEESKVQRLAMMKESGLLPRGLTLSQYEAWLANASGSVKETLTYQMSDIQAGLRDVLSLAVVDGHIDANAIEVNSVALAEDYEELFAPLRELTKEQQELKHKMQLFKQKKGDDLTPDEQIRYEELKNEIQQFRIDNEHAIKRIEALKYIDRLKQLSLEELEAKSLMVNKKRISFNDVFATLEHYFSKSPDFLTDLRRIRDLINEGNRQIFKGEKVSRSELTLTDAVDLETHTLIGEVPVASCQNYGGSASLNVGLLSYIADPGVKIVQIRDEGGAIIARSILRMLEDEQQQPRLFMERIYSVNNHPKIKEAMITFALNKAKALGVSLYSQEENVPTPNEFGDKGRVILHSRGSRTPFIYTDAGGGRAANGIFDVTFYS